MSKQGYTTRRLPMKKMSFLWMFLLLPLSLFSFDDQPPCFKEMQTTFFRQEYVEHALSLHNVYQARYPIIMQSLRSRSQSVPETMKQRTMLIVPSPLDYPFDPVASGNLLKDILLEIFVAVMKENLVSNGNYVNENDVKDMFNYIFNRQLNEWNKCLNHLL